MKSIKNIKNILQIEEKFLDVPKKLRVDRTQKSKVSRVSGVHVVLWYEGSD